MTGGFEGGFIAVEGAPGSGKTHLALEVADLTGARAILDDASDNPFLDEFMGSGGEDSFRTEVWFTLARYRIMEKIRQPELFHRGTVTDFLFKRSLIYSSLFLPGDESVLYHEVFSALAPVLPSPDAVIFVRSSVEDLFSGSEAESSFDPAMLELIVGAYNHFFLGYADSPLVILDRRRLLSEPGPGIAGEVLSALQEARSGGRRIIDFSPQG